MNRQNLWFVTLFSLILILGVYYITLPSDIFSKSALENVNKNVDVVVTENDKLVALRVERDEEISTVMSELQNKITSPSSSTEVKNAAFEELQILNNFKIKSFVEINNDNIKITIASSEHNSKLANDIMRSVQEEFKDKKNITIKFES